jgi:predicted dithiol-disulfide oxidoreductase (DUF899 family)
VRVRLMAISRAPVAALTACKQRMGWTFPWASSLNSDFNHFNTSVTEEQQRSGVAEYNCRGVETTWLQTDLAAAGGVATMAAMTGTDVATYTGEAPSVSAFALEDGVVYHTYSAYSRPRRALGQCTSGSTGRRRGATRPTSG